MMGDFPKGNDAVKKEAIGAIAALSITALLVFIAGLMANSAESQVRPLTNQELRLDTKDRLIGVKSAYISELFEDRDPDGKRATEGQELRLLWVLDPGRCTTCLDDLGLWNALSEDPDLRTHLLVVEPSDGAHPSETSRLVHLSRSPGSTETEAVVESALGTIPPSSVFLLDRDGVVVFTDGSGRLNDCAWTAMVQVGALVGAVRSAAVGDPLTVADSFPTHNPTKES